MAPELDALATQSSPSKRLAASGNGVRSTAEPSEPGRFFGMLSRCVFSSLRIFDTVLRRVWNTYATHTQAEQVGEGEPADRNTRRWAAMCKE